MWFRHGNCVILWVHLMGAVREPPLPAKGPDSRTARIREGPGFENRPYPRTANQRLYIQLAC
jgi:hypothetical protein